MKKINFNNIYEWPLITRILIIGLICAVVLYLGYYLKISYLSTQLVGYQQKEQELKQQIQFIISKQGAMNNEIAQFSQLQNLLKQWQGKMVAYTELPELLNEILKIGATNHLHFSLFHPDPAVQTGIYYKVPIKLVAVGGYHQLGDFLSQIANMKWIVVISDFILTSENKNDVLGSKLAADAAAENLLTAELTFEVYYLAGKAEKK